jgi:V8-like Glu-specific endopeptidase
MNRLRLHAPIAAVLVASAFFATPARALPLGHAGEAEAAKAAATERRAEVTTVDFTAIVALDDCSGSLVRLTTSKDTDPAFVLTNGHCYEGGFLKAGEVLVAQASDRTFSLLTSDGQGTKGTLTAAQIVYATMTGTDFTLYKLTDTYADIAKRFGVKPLTVLDHHPVAGTPIRVVSGFWRKIYSCSIDKFVFELKEADWTFQDSIRYTEPGCEVIGGTSGSPVIDADTGEVVGINNTTNEDGETCTLDNPCEVDASGKTTVELGASYGQELYQLYTCMTPANELDLEQPGCVLAKPASATAKR